MRVAPLFCPAAPQRRDRVACILATIVVVCRSRMAFIIPDAVGKRLLFANSVIDARHPAVHATPRSPSPATRPLTSPKPRFD